MQPEQWPLTTPLPRPDPNGATPAARPLSPTDPSYRGPNVVGSKAPPIRFNPGRAGDELERYAPNSSNVNLDKVMGRLKVAETELARAQSEIDALQRENQNLRHENEELRRRGGNVFGSVAFGPSVPQPQSGPHRPLTFSPGGESITYMGQTSTGQLVPVVRTFSPQPPIKVDLPPIHIRVHEQSPPRMFGQHPLVRTPPRMMMQPTPFRVPQIIASAPQKQSMASPLLRPVVPEAAPRPFSPMNQSNVMPNWDQHEMIPPPPPPRAFSPNGVSRVPSTQQPRAFRRPDTSQFQPRPTDHNPNGYRRDPTMYTPTAPIDDRRRLDESQHRPSSNVNPAMQASGYPPLVERPSRIFG